MESKKRVVLPSAVEFRAEGIKGLWGRRVSVGGTARRDDERTMSRWKHKKVRASSVTDYLFSCAPLADSMVSRVLR